MESLFRVCDSHPSCVYTVWHSWIFFLIINISVKKSYWRCVRQYDACAILLYQNEHTWLHMALMWPHMWWYHLFKSAKVTSFDTVHDTGDRAKKKLCEINNTVMSRQHFNHAFVSITIQNGILQSIFTAVTHSLSLSLSFDLIKSNSSVNYTLCIRKANPTIQVPFRTWLPNLSNENRARERERPKRQQNKK